jgi:hypothetical protein
MPDQQQAEWDETYEYQRGDLPRLVVEGDSWFAYPMWRNMIDFLGASNRYALCRRGESGRLLQEIADEGQYLQAVQEEGPTLVLISGSGNDFVNDRFVTGADGQGQLFERYEAGMSADQLINAGKWQRKLEQLAGWFEGMIRSLNGVPIVTHGYDYIVPDGRGARYDGAQVAGPWIQPAMIARGITGRALQVQIAALMIDSLNDMLAGLQSEFSDRFVHVDLRGTLQPGDWANEIHPYGEGFAVLAARYLVAVDAAFNRVRSGSPTLIADAGDDT